MSSAPPHTTRDAIPVAHSVSSFDGTTIRYDLYDDAAQRAAIVVPGFWRERRHPALVRLASFLSSIGLCAAVCDLRGHGESGGRFGFNLHEHHDVAAVARDVLTRTRAESLVLIGLSYGGSIAISATARDGLPVAGVITISAVADFRRVAPRPNPLTLHRHIALGQALHRPRFDWPFRPIARLSAADDVADVHAPAAFIHVRNDWLIGHAHALALFERANEPKELHILDIPGNYHADRIFNVAQTTVDGIIEAFLARYAGIE